MRKKVYVTRKILEPALSMLLKECNVVLNNKDRPPTRKEILKNIRNKDGILCMLSDKIDAEVMVAGPKLKVISSYIQELIILTLMRQQKEGFMSPLHRTYLQKRLPI